MIDRIMQNPIYIWPRNWYVHRQPETYTEDDSSHLADDWWEYLRIQKATAVDEDHGCTWCKEKGHPMEQGYLHFHKGDLVAREHFSAQDFTTLHLTCALEKLNIIRDELDKGVRKLSSIIEADGNQVRRNERDY